MDMSSAPTERDMELPLGLADCGFTGEIASVRAESCASGITDDELERRLIELGFVEGASVEILHEGIFRRDPIAVRVHGLTIALRRREAMAICVRRTSAQSCR